jgi:hypothetical protein
MGGVTAISVVRHGEVNARGAPPVIFVSTEKIVKKRDIRIKPFNKIMIFSGL